MNIGVLKEIKTREYRVGLVPAGVRELVEAGQKVYVQAQAGVGSGFSDADYQAAGASVVNSAEAVFERSELIVKVKEPQACERKLLQAHHTLFAYLHLAPDPDQAHDLLTSGATCIAYETVQDRQGRLPLLAPMSEVAGRLAVQAAARCLEKVNGGAGVLMGGVPGVPPAKVCVLGGGVVGTNAARIAMGMGAAVTVLDKSIDRLRTLDDLFGPRLQTLVSNASLVEQEVSRSDVVIGAVLIPGAASPKLVDRALLKKMNTGSVVVDVAIDQGGCFETSKPTTHDDPFYVVDGVVHYCVANMPGAVARTSTMALTNATLPFVLKLAGLGHKASEDPMLASGINVYRGQCTNAPAANALGLPYHSLAS